jgi:glutathione S-transferase
MPMGELVLTTYDWVPEPPRGMVRDLRVRWALEEAGLPYRVATTPFDAREAAHLAHQPFGQVPWLTDGDISVFESGAILLHLGGKSPALMPADPRGQAETMEWVFAALNSVEAATQPWSLFRFMGFPGNAPEAEFVDGFVKVRLERLEAVLASREWLAGGGFSVADLLMADVLRPVDKFDGLAAYPACRAYLARITGRPAFKKAHADQLAHFAAADRARAAAKA